MDGGFSISVADRFCVYVSFFCRSSLLHSETGSPKLSLLKLAVFSVQTYAPRGEHDVIVVFFMRFSFGILLLDVDADHLQSFCQSENRRVLGVRLQSFDYGVDVSTHKIFFKCYDLCIIIGPERMQNFVQAIDQWLFSSRLADTSCRLLSHRFNSRVLLEYEILTFFAARSLKDIACSLRWLSR